MDPLRGLAQGRVGSACDTLRLGKREGFEVRAWERARGRSLVRKRSVCALGHGRHAALCRFGHVHDAAQSLLVSFAMAFGLYEE